MQPITMTMNRESGYTPLDERTLSEEEAQAVVMACVARLKTHLDATPIVDRYLFSTRAEKVLRREQVTTWDQLRMLTQGVKKGSVQLRQVGPRVVREWTEALASVGVAV